MPAYIKCQRLPDGSQQFVFCTQEIGGHGDLIGGAEEFDDFLKQTIILANREQTQFGLRLQGIVHIAAMPSGIRN